MAARLLSLLPPWLTVEAATRGYGWGVCACYVFAFGSFYPQIGALLGPVRRPTASRNVSSASGSPPTNHRTPGTLSRRSSA